MNQALAQLEAEYEHRVGETFGVPSTSQAPQRFGFIIQAGQAFTESFLTAIEKQRNNDRALEIEGLGAASNEEVVEAIKGWTGGLDGLAIVCKNIPRIIDELKRLRQAGKRVMALVSDIESSARSAYLGIDNRAAGNVAAYLMGRHLVTEPLLRTQQIDYLIVQDLNEIVRRATQFMREIPSDDRQSHELEGIPFRLLTQFNLG